MRPFKSTPILRAFMNSRLSFAFSDAGDKKEGQTTEGQTGFSNEIN